MRSPSSVTTPSTVELSASVFHLNVHLRIRSTFQRVFLSPHIKKYPVYFGFLCACVGSSWITALLYTAQTLNTKKIIWETLEMLL